MICSPDGASCLLDSKPGLTSVDLVGKLSYLLELLAFASRSFFHMLCSTHKESESSSSNCGSALSAGHDPPLPLCFHSAMLDPDPLPDQGCTASVPAKPVRRHCEVAGPGPAVCCTSWHTYRDAGCGRDSSQQAHEHRHVAQVPRDPEAGCRCRHCLL